MKGFTVQKPTANAILAAIEEAFVSRGNAACWSPGALPIYTGPHAGMSVIPADDNILDTPLRHNPTMTPRDFPEFDDLLTMLGGLDARVEIDPADIINPDQLQTDES